MRSTYKQITGGAVKTVSNCESSRPTGEREPAGFLFQR